MSVRSNHKSRLAFELPNGDLVRFTTKRRPALGLALGDDAFRDDLHGQFESLILASERIAGEPELRRVQPAAKDMNRLRDRFRVVRGERALTSEAATIDAAAAAMLEPHLGRTTRERFATALDQVIARALAAGDRETALVAAASALALLADGSLVVPAVANRLLHAIGALVEPPPAPLREPNATPPRRLVRYARRIRRLAGTTCARTQARHLAKGTRLFQQGLPSQALEEFQKAYLLADAPRERLAPLLETARCHFRLEQRDAALAALRLARAVAARIPASATPEMKTTTVDRLGGTVDGNGNGRRTGRLEAFLDAPRPRRRAVTDVDVTDVTEGKETAHS